LPKWRNWQTRRTQKAKRGDLKSQGNQGKGRNDKGLGDFSPFLISTGIYSVLLLTGHHMDTRTILVYANGISVEDLWIKFPKNGKNFPEFDEPKRRKLAKFF